MVERPNPSVAATVWQVSALCRALADTLQARFNPVTVRGEMSGLIRAASGHCYFALKDDSAQLRCAMFRRAAEQLRFAPRDGDLVQLQGRLDVYGPRGDLQLIVERMERAGQGAWFEQFLRLKERLQAEGLFDAGRKRPLPALPRRIGVVTSLGAAALRDVATALQRRVPHIPVVLVPALVQGEAAPGALMRALQTLYAGALRAAPEAVDVILLVRGGGSIEDLWAFNDEALARCIAASPVPVICGVGHETDFTIADFVADLRAPTPTAAAEMVSQPRDFQLDGLDLLGQRLASGVQYQVDAKSQRLDLAGSRLGRPSALAARQRLKLSVLSQRLAHGASRSLQRQGQALQQIEQLLPQRRDRWVEAVRQRLDRLGLRLELLDPALVLQRGYAWLSDAAGQPVTRATQAQPGQSLQATLADGTLDLTVSATLRK